MSFFLTTLHVAACIFLVAVVLLQHGKGADMGAAFGSGASSTVFGSRGAGTPRSVTDLIEESPAEVPMESTFPLQEPSLPEAPGTPEEPAEEPGAPPLGNVEPIPSPAGETD